MIMIWTGRDISAGPTIGPSIGPGGFTKIAQPVPFAGTRKVTFTVAPGGTTFGVADPTQPPQDALLVLLGHEQRRGFGAPVA